MDWQFWSHIEMFPDARNISRNLVDRLANTLSYGWNDLMTSETSTTPYNADKIAELSRLIDIMKRGTADEHHAIIVARNMATLCKERFYNYHGQPSARLNRDESMSEENIHHPRSLIFLALSPLLFWMPDIYLAELERVWVDDTVNYTPWNKFMNKLIRDWKSSEMPAIVLLVVNAGSLAVQNIYVTETTTDSVSTVAYYASTMFSLTSYVVGQILTRQYHTMVEQEDVTAVAIYLKGKSDLYYGLEYPAFAYSIPAGCFIWRYHPLTLHPSMNTGILTWLFLAY
ncbi:hypothetical protein QCA50_020264 [Cerrena zonata]|uniref:Uncharacterized protein n=1 Tax=Cerrena zonata TaxID=2478898 RepID=A0AAW0F9H1_9APHY